MARASFRSSVFAAAVAVAALPAAAEAPAFSGSPVAKSSKVKCGGKKATIVGTPGRDVIRAPKFGNQVIAGLGGNDVIYSNKGTDRICGGPGDDRLYPGKGKDRAYGDSGNDYIQAEKGTNRLEGGSGNDRILGGPGTDLIKGGSGNDSIASNAKKDKVSGGSGNDTINGGDDGDTIHGDGGDDIIRGAEGGDKLYGDSGNDRVFGELLDDKMYGGPGNDMLSGGHGIDDMDGGSGDDWIRGGTNQDNFIGGPGSDTASFMSALPDNNYFNGSKNGVVTVDLKGGTASGPGGKDTLSSIENALGSAFNDNLIGDGGANTLDGGPGDDSINGGAGSDKMIGGPGQDVCDTGLGDTSETCGSNLIPELTPNPRPRGAYAYIDPRGPDPGLVVSGQLPGATAASPSENIRISAVAGGFRISGNAGTTVEPYDGGYGGGCTGGGSSVFCPSPASPLGYVSVWGDTGADTLTMGGGFDPSTTVDMDGGPDNDTLNGGPNDEVLFSGQTGRDILNGGAGDDALIAEGFGGDKLNAGSGRDQLVTDDVCQGHDYNGGSGQDIAGFGRYLQALQGRGGVTVKLGAYATDPSRRGCSPTKVRSNNEILEGSAGDDVLIGKPGKKNLLILGREGDDIIRGGGKADSLLGNAGADSLYGLGGYDKIDAKDGQRDKVIDCGPGGGKVKKDGKDPRPKNC